METLISRHLISQVFQLNLSQLNLTTVTTRHSTNSVGEP